MVSLGMGPCDCMSSLTWLYEIKLNADDSQDYRQVGERDILVKLVGKQVKA